MISRDANLARHLFQWAGKRTAMQQDRQQLDFSARLKDQFTQFVAGAVSSDAQASNDRSPGDNLIIPTYTGVCL